MWWEVVARLSCCTPMICPRGPLSNSDIMLVVSQSESTWSDCLHYHKGCATRNLGWFGVRVVAIASGAFNTRMTNITTKKAQGPSTISRDLLFSRHTGSRVRANTVNSVRDDQYPVLHTTASESLSIRNVSTIITQIFVKTESGQTSNLKVIPLKLHVVSKIKLRGKMITFFENGSKHVVAEISCYSIPWVIVSSLLWHYYN